MDKETRDAIENIAIVAILGGIVVAVVGAVMYGLPLYWVWNQSLSGKAELQKAEFTRQVAVIEARAKLDSASKLADAEIARAKGVAEANKIIGSSLKSNKEYLQYLYITGIQEGSEKGNRTIYVPTEGGLPIPTLDMTERAK